MVCAARRGVRRFNVMQMAPRKALAWLAPGLVCSALVVGLRQFDTDPVVILLVSIIGFVPSLLIVMWGTMKFRSYYEVQRTRADHWTMLHATIIQLVAIAPSGFLLVTMFEVIDQLQL